MNPVSKGYSESVKSFSHVSLFATSWTVACQVPLSMEFSRQEYWGGWPCSSPENLPNPGIESWSPTLQADTLPFELPCGLQINKNSTGLFKSSVIKYACFS